jgi:hypothetical protein
MGKGGTALRSLERKETFMTFPFRRKGGLPYFS